jgi:quinol-cytochrome oxidoreductase complex cytochrome b subunit
VVLAVLLHMARVFFGAAYKPPRETNWLVGLFLLFVVLAFGATGYLLPWDQWSYWTVTQGLDVVEHVPVVGGAIVQILRGDPIVSGATLSRFFAVHVILLPWIMLGLLMLHFSLVRKHGIAPPVHPRPGDEQPGEPFFPTHLVRAFVIGVLVLSVVISLAALYPRPVSAVADPARVPDMLLSNWVMADVSRAVTYYLGAWGVAIFVLLGIILALLPLFDRSPERSLRRRPLVASLGFIFFLGFIVAWVAGRELRTMPLAVTGESQQLMQPAVPSSGRPVPAVGPSTPQTPQPDTAGAGRVP